MSPTDPPLTPGGNDDDADEPSWERTGELPIVPPDAPVPESQTPAPPLPADDPGAGPTEPLPAIGGDPADEPTAVVGTTGGDDGVPPTAVLPTTTGGDGDGDGDSGDGDDDSLADLSLTQQLARRRVSHRRYVLRRIMVVGVLVLLVGAAVTAIVLLASGDGDSDDQTAGSVPNTADATEPVVMPASTKPRTTSASATTSTTPATTSTRPATTSTTEAPAVVDPTEPADEASDTDADATEPDATEPEATEPQETQPQDTEPEETEVPESSTPATTEAGEIEYDLTIEPDCEMEGGAKVDQAGDDVECLEERLMQITDDALDLDVDRIFDDRTDAAVRAFQEFFELNVDGVVGPETASKLGIWPGSWPPDTSPDTSTDE